VHRSSDVGERDVHISISNIKYIQYIMCTFQTTLMAMIVLPILSEVTIGHTHRYSNTVSLSFLLSKVSRLKYVLKTMVCFESLISLVQMTPQMKINCSWCKPKSNLHE
jgi:purine-cytosine permease-like protein